MKTRLRALVFLSIALTLPSARAQNERAYMFADLGGQVTEDTRLKQFFGETIAAGSKVVFDPGARLSFGGGFRITDWWALEGETSIITSKIKSITGASRVDGAFLFDLPLLFNTRFEVPGEKKFLTPFMGGGLGVCTSVIEADLISLGGSSMSGGDATYVLAYQAFGGLRFRLSSHIGLSLKYNYFVTTGSAWDADLVFGSSSDQIKFAGTVTHSGSITFEYRF